MKDCIFKTIYYPILFHCYSVVKYFNFTPQLSISFTTYSYFPRLNLWMNWSITHRVSPSKFKYVSSTDDVSKLHLYTLLHSLI